MFVAPLIFATLSLQGAGAAPRPADRMPAPPQGKAWKLAWNDEFDGRKLDETKWDVPPDSVRRDGWWMRKAIDLDGRGHLSISTIKEGDRLIDGCVRTRGKFEHAFGYYVARVQMHKEVGHWPAFWLYNACEGNVGNGGVDGAEIDIFEKPWLTDHINCAIHWDGYGSDHKSEGRKLEAPGVSKGWHTFGLWWSDDAYIFYVDGREVWRTSAGGVCKEPLYIKLSDEIGSWAGKIQDAKLPDRFLVDYVRVYDLVDAGP